LVTFLAWTSEPEMETRKRTGIAVMLFLFVMCFVSYGSMRYIWADVKKAKA
jgi:ubiquinol-cytochrome c reductase cytochrome c1 subunit